MKCFAWLAGRGRRLDTGAPEPETSLVQGPRDLGLSLRARTPDSVSYQVPPRRVVVGPTEGVVTEKERFQTTTVALERLGGWLADRRVSLVAMEATGVYWKPVVRHEVPRVRAEVEGLRLRSVAAGR